MGQNPPQNRFIPKRSIRIGQTQTSITVEDSVWEGFREIAADRKMRIHQLAAEVAAGPDPHENLSSAIRTFVLSEFRRRSE